MNPRSKYQFLLVIYFLCLVLCARHSAAQQGSIYFSAGYNMSWYDKSTIHIEQSDLGNSYDMVKVKGNNKTNTAISATQLNYRLGFFYNDPQTNGVELNFDPVNYQVADNQRVHISGIVNNMVNVKKTLLMSKSAGSYYNFIGANLLMLNMVKRIRIYQANTKKIAVDAIVKVGAGPAFPHFASSLPVNPIDDPAVQFAGWNAGAEAGVRVRIYRYLYFEFTGKYDYATFNSMTVYDGTARQNLSTYEVTGSIGFTFPTTKSNPLFCREHNIITILPFFQHKDEVGKRIVKKVKYEEDSLANKALDSIPEFQEILERKYRKEHPQVIIKDTTKATWLVDSLGRPVGKDSIVAPQDNDSTHLSKRQLRKKKKQEEKAKKALEEKAQELGTQDSTKAPIVPEEAPKVPDAVPTEPKAPQIKEPEKKDTAAVTTDQEPKVPELSKKELKRKAKEERKAQEEKAKQEEKARLEQEEKDRKALEEKAKQEQEKADQEKARQEQEEKDKKALEEKARQEQEKADQEKARLEREQERAKREEEKKELKIKAKEEKRALKEKEKQDKEKAKQDKEKQDTPPPDNSEKKDNGN